MISDYLAIFNLKLEFFRSNSRQRCKVAVPGAVYCVFKKTSGVFTSLKNVDWGVKLI